MKQADKQIEFERYESKAELFSSLFAERGAGAVPINEQFLPKYLQPPHIFYRKELQRIIKSGDRVLEIGSGTGQFTAPLIKSGASVTASDISPKALQVLSERFDNPNNLELKTLDMQHLPFQNGSFDHVVMAGSLSYGENLKVRDEIYRILKRGGRFICVDSLSGNPIYSINRYLHYLRGRRSWSTLKNMPNKSTLVSYKSLFSEVEIRYFGTFSFLMPLLNIVASDDACTSFSNRLDSIPLVKNFGFKFVMVARS